MIRSAGSILLVVSSEAVFKQIVPFLILGACGLLAVQDRLRAWLRSSSRLGGSHATLEIIAVAIGAVYGGYFGAGLGIMLMAVLGLFSELPFNRLNAVKQMLSFLVNVSAAARITRCPTCGLPMKMILSTPERTSASPVAPSLQASGQGGTTDTGSTESRCTEESVTDDTRCA